MAAELYLTLAEGTEYEHKSVVRTFARGSRTGVRAGGTLDLRAKAHLSDVSAGLLHMSG
jgi:hypothetical protein